MIVMFILKITLFMYEIVHSIVSSAVNCRSTFFSDS